MSSGISKHNKVIEGLVTFKINNNCSFFEIIKNIIDKFLQNNVHFRVYIIEAFLHAA